MPTLLNYVEISNTFNEFRLATNQIVDAVNILNSTGISNIDASSITSGTLNNARTTANTANGASTIVLRDSNGDFSARNVTLNTVTATTLSGALSWADVTNKPDPVITVALTGDIVGNANAVLSDLTSNTISISTTIAANSVALGTDTTGNYIATLSSGTPNTQSGTSGLTITAAAGEGVAATIAHADTSDLIGSYGTSGIKDITLDTFGHIIAVNTEVYLTPSGNGVNLTSLNASNITTGLVGAARLAVSGTANNQTFLRGDQTWAQIVFPSGVTAGSTSTGYLQYSGTSVANGQLNGSSTNPTNTLRLNYEGHFYATKLFGDGSSLSGIISGATITNDTTTNSSTFYIGMANNQTSGSWTQAFVSSTKLYFNPSTGTLNATNFNSLSDLNFKEDIRTIENAVSTIKKIDGVNFKWKETGKKSYGVIAQELEKILPELVEGDDIKTVNYSGLIAYLINAVKELDDRVKHLESL